MVQALRLYFTIAIITYLQALQELLYVLQVAVRIGLLYHRILLVFVGLRQLAHVCQLRRVCQLLLVAHLLAAATLVEAILNLVQILVNIFKAKAVVRCLGLLLHLLYFGRQRPEPGDIVALRLDAECDQIAGIVGVGQFILP